ncbi:MAG: hypothetical protein MJY68_10120 [Bacteroidaceae bacterium]|nr:hypothetical protein [Bacteroidaceae bacterium]
MAKLNDILDAEKQRPDEASRRVIHFYQEGSFLRAYEWSAWLCCRYLNDFKATRRVLKGTDDTMVFIGFPLTSLDKYRTDGREVVNVDEKAVDMLLPEDMLKGELTETDFKHWKQSVPLAESSRKEGQDAIKTAQSAGQGMSLTGIMQRVLAFPIESKSPLDCMVFLADVKQQLAMII